MDDVIKFGPGTLYIGDQELIDNIVPCFQEHREEIEEYIERNAMPSFNNHGECTFTMTLDRIAVCKLIGLWDWAYKYCPNRKIKHLMEHGKTMRTRLKNFDRAMRLIKKMCS